MMNLLLPVILGTITILTIGLDHFWGDRRTKKYKRTRKILITIIVLAVVVNLVVAYSSEQHTTSLQERFMDPDPKVLNFIKTQNIW